MFFLNFQMRLYEFKVAFIYFPSYFHCKAYMHIDAGLYPKAKLNSVHNAKVSLSLADAMALPERSYSYTSIST